jgi:endonuclease/exonuclease/phosphatase family metal-dependent hydrolase
MRSLRVLTWNVHGLRDGRAGVLRVLHAMRADIVVLQEVPRLLVPSLAARRLARDAGLQCAVGGRSARGNAIFVQPTLRVMRGWVQSLSHVNGLHRRAACHALVEGIHVVGVHLSLDRVQRAAHVEQIVASLGQRTPAVLAGDFNEPKGGPTWLAWHRVGLMDPIPNAPATFPESGQRIDAVLMRSVEVHGYATGHAEVPGRFSDHLPVLNTVTRP